MSDADALGNFTAKWRARWPEWSIAEVFVAPSQRAVALAWFALLQEITEAAWGGEDAAPGLAKLAWWQEELHGWSQGRRRHPLGAALQSHPAPWDALSAALSTLPALRGLQHGVDDAILSLDVFAASVVQVEAVLFDTRESTTSAMVSGALLVMHPALSGADVTSLRTASLPWLAAGGPRARRIVSALVRARLVSDIPLQPPSRWRTLWLAWRAARN